jgi:RNA polymerase sigma factor (sigma-70 family)
MLQINADNTSPSLLARVASLSNQPAWAEFVRYYDPRLRRWCRLFSLDSDLSDELCQRIWIELIRKMPSYRYDPGGSFRGWLWILFRFRALNLIKERRGEVVGLVDVSVLQSQVSPSSVADDEPDERVLTLLREAEAIHQSVKQRVKPWRWEAYWRIIVEREDIGATARALEMNYAAAYAAAHYVDGMVRAEGRRRRDDSARND